MFLGKTFKALMQQDPNMFVFRKDLTKTIHACWYTITKSRGRIGSGVPGASDQGRES